MGQALPQPKICILSVVDGATLDRRSRAVHESISWIHLSRLADGTAEIVLRDGETSNRPAEKVAIGEGPKIVGDLLNRLEPDLVVCTAGDYWPEVEALLLAARVARPLGSWAVHVDVAMQSRRGFIYPYGDFVAYRATPSEPDLRLPLSLANLPLSRKVALEHLDDILRLPGSVHWQRLLAMRLELKFGMPQRLPIVTGWRRFPMGLGTGDMRLGAAAPLSLLVADTQRAAMEAEDDPPQIRLLVALQSQICRLTTFAEVAPAAEAESAKEAGSPATLLAEILRQRIAPVALAAEIVDQIGLSSLEGLEVEPSDVLVQIARRLRYAHDMRVFRGVGVDLRLLADALGVDDEADDSPVTPTILLLVGALSLGQGPRPGDLVIENLAMLGGHMDANFSNALEYSERRQEKFGHSPLGLQGLPRELAKRMIEKLGLTSTALRIRAGAKKLRRVS